MSDKGIERKLVEIEVCLQEKQYQRIKDILTNLRQYMIAQENSFERRSRDSNVAECKNLIRDVYYWVKDDTIGISELDRRLKNKDLFKKIK